MKRTKTPHHNTASDQSREDVARIHKMLRVAIAHIEKKANCITEAGVDHNEDSLDEVLTGLTKITALISKLIPIEKEIDAERSSQDETILEDAIDWDLLEQYFRKKNVTPIKDAKI